MAVASQVRVQLLSLLSSEDWFTEDLVSELPSKWEKHGDLILFPEKTFSTTEVWMNQDKFLEAVCDLLHCKRLARKVGPTQNDDFRSPKVKLLYGDSTWVTKKENRVLYSWDLSKCMFSSGNITEKRRIATWYLRGKVVVDLYSGIGYFTLTYLVHSKADFVYACEWNPDAVQALEANIKLNNISMDRYQILEGDNRLTCPKNVCDHVNLGLIPSSEASWRTACAALKKSTGGVLHIHGNVDTKGPGSGVTSTSGNNFYSAIKFPTKTDYHVEWSKYVCCAIQKIFGVLYPNETWEVNIDAVIKIKSFAPHVDHLVTDITCKPILSK